jgi:hypothetical protein
MNERLAAIAHRRAGLVARAAAQRSEIVRVAQHWRTPLALVDRGADLMRTLRAHPLAILIGVALLVRLSRGRRSAWFGRIWTAWTLYRSLSERLPRFSA